MNTKNDSLTDIAQLDELNKSAWTTLESGGKTILNVKPECDGALLPSEEIVIVTEAAPKAT
jgi:hypothetical protein